MRASQEGTFFCYFTFSDIKLVHKFTKLLHIAAYVNKIAVELCNL